jgi:hypothetical protein
LEDQAHLRSAPEQLTILKSVVTQMAEISQAEYRLYAEFPALHGERLIDAWEAAVDDDESGPYRARSR